MDPYKVLDIPRNASEKRIKQAFRKRSLATHPDRGGSAEQFQEVREAYRVLGDPELRREYDSTGQMPSGKPDTSDAEMRGLIFAALNAACQSCRPVGAGKRDIVKAMQAWLTEEVKKARGSRKQNAETRDFFQAVLDRTTDDEGALADILRSQVREGEAILAKIDGVIALHERAILYMRKVKYRKDESGEYSILTGDMSSFLWTATSG